MLINSAVNKIVLVIYYKMEIGVLYPLLLFSIIFESCGAENENTAINSDETCNVQGKYFAFLQFVLTFKSNEISALASKSKIINCR